MFDSVRICYPRIDSFLAYNHDNKKFTGYNAVLFSMLIEDLVLPLVKNITIVSEDNLGHILDRETLDYSGCVGSIQRNESDFMPIPHIFPVFGPGLIQGPVVLSESMYIMSAYLDEHKETVTDVMECFTSFELQVWLLLALALLLIAVTFIFLGGIRPKSKILDSHSSLEVLRIIQFHGKIMQPQEQPPPRRNYRVIADLIIGSLLKQYSSIPCCKSTPRAIFSSFTILFTFLIGHYFSSFIKTQLVTPIKPVTITTYDDILERPEVRPIWVQDFAEYDAFEYAEEGTKSKAIWDKAVSMGISKSFAKGSMDALILVGIDITEQQAVLLAKSKWLNLLLTGICSLSRNEEAFDNAVALSRVDPEAKESLSSVPIGSEFYNRHPEQSNAVIIRTHQAFETGYVTKAFSFLDFTIASPEKGKLESVRVCLCNEILMPHRPFESPRVEHFTFLFTTYLVMLVVSALVFVSEYYRAP
jgi:hypothetical protein